MVDKLDLKPNTCKYYVVVALEGTRLRIIVPREHHEWWVGCLRRYFRCSTAPSIGMTCSLCTN
jgi:hypothetical protein